jgi:hypothetical protein
MLQVVYASKPQATGGPYRSALGLAVFPGQRAVQTIEAPNVVVNEVGDAHAPATPCSKFHAPHCVNVHVNAVVMQLSYKALGFVPGSVRQQGEFTALDGNTFQVSWHRVCKSIVSILFEFDAKVRPAARVP